VHALSARTDDELTDTLRVGDRVGVLEREAFVVVVVRAQDDIGVVLVEHAPERVGAGVAAVVGAGGEARLVPVGEDAGLVGREQVTSQPLHLGRCGRGVDLGVQRDHMPRAEVEGVVPLASFACRTVVHADAVEVVEVAGRARRQVLVVSDPGSRDGLVDPPALVVALRVLRCGALLVLGVAKGEDDGCVREQVRGRLLPAACGRPVAVVEVRREWIARRVAGRCDYRIGRR
jgi:hypothetical protein